MSGAADWFSQLEQQLEAQLNAFLQANPAQEQLLHQEEQRERQRRLKRRRLELQTSAEQTRSTLLALARDIAQWQERVQRARAAGATELAERADSHVAALMAQGRDRWQALGELGVSFRAVEEELAGLAAQATPPDEGSPAAEAKATQAKTPDLDQAWAAFEAEQELEQLKRRQRETS
jgi:hercynine metabolism protein